MRVFFFIIFLIVGIVAVSYFFSGGATTPKQNQLVTSVQRQDLTVELNVIGVLDAAQAHMISAELRGSQGKIIYLIDDGTLVSKGDLLIQFDPLPFQKEVELLKAEVASFDAAVQAAEQEVAFQRNLVQREVANTEYLLSVALLDFKRLDEGEGPLQISKLQEEQQKAKLELQRHERYYLDLMDLKAEGYQNVSEIEAIEEKVGVLKKQFDTATNRYESYKKHVLPALLEGGRAKKLNAELVLEQTRQGGVYKVAKAQATLNQIKSKLEAKRAALQQAEIELQKTEIHAPFDGIVIHYESFRDEEKRKPREGDTVFMNQPILYLPDVSRMVVKTKAREIDLYKLALGQRGRVLIDAYPDTTFEGELTFIGALATAETTKAGQEKYFDVIFALKGEDMRLRPGMTCRIAILAQSLKQVLTIPVEAVFQEGNQDYCYVQNATGSQEARAVTVGAFNENIAEIISGLKEGEKVSLVKPGR
jgi:HlyD family secretion protein